jgi:hypothetical protein
MYLLAQNGIYIATRREYVVLGSWCVEAPQASHA